MQKCEIEVICADAVERAHTNSLDANDKLIQTRSHVRDTVASRKRQVIMRKGKSTITANSFPQSIIARLVLNLLKSRDTIAVLQRSTAFDAFPLLHTRIFLNV